ncbi:glycosyltransferase family 10 domain-containing protein [Capnocytophaga catalasegens]|uniref:Alpha-(1,3)-fucosyltransferase FucT N-terminal domain-containing protein n=1 Tax=Capnocytophaga catalasegens TaxID=1004260 RepID=A0AAV5ATT9_9FLAO|nr:glycosyltransferase family 10 [Capnocytophaga catalasegens]GIZ15180.1 hypothetical protein RCZ03_11800 [Capnocytophaga catalasegens]GJM49695.1 hypothetical protein RCZ15_06700 [Capnocytophaga catalasegens]GJM52760.1 hypothetical protein RCZ16_10770 [Capnocytophaga catalasegens]
MKILLKQLNVFFRWLKKEYKMWKNPIDVKFYNHWEGILTENSPNRLWFYRFIKNRNIKTSMTFFSVFGFRWFMKFFRGKKVFFTGEYVQKGGITKSLETYADNCVNDVNLSMGFDYIKHPNYVRFPLWILYFVQPEMTFEDLKNRIETINNPLYRKNQERTKFCVQMSRHDKNNTRRKMINLLNKIEQVTCAGIFMNNADELKTKYNDNKVNYLRNFKFNICPENISAKGYITEKILDAIVGGCIPIYYGGGKKEWVESNIFNPNAFLYYEEGKEEKLFKEVKKLYSDSEAYNQFIAEPPFKENATEFIWEKITEIENRLKNL